MQTVSILTMDSVPPPPPAKKTSMGRVLPTSSVVVDRTLSAATDHSSSVHGMRRASLVPSAHNEYRTASMASDYNGSERSFFTEGHSLLSQSQSDDDDSVRFSAKQFVTQRAGTLTSFYEIGALIGEGGFGEVFCCTHKVSGDERAVKCLKKDLQRDDVNEQVILEFNTIRSLDSPNLLKVYEMYEDPTHFYIVTDLYQGGDLFTELEEGGCFNEADAADVMNTILTCVNYCHGKGLAHCDLKPENVLLDGQDLNDLKIIDFGLAQYTNPEDENDKFTCMKGSRYYVSPQIIEGSYTNKCDIWACGVMVYMLLSGTAPFDGDTEDGTYDAVLEGVVSFDDETWDDVSEEAKDFISYLLTYEENERPTAEQALQHPWLQEQRELFFDRTEQRECARQGLLDLKSFNSTESPYDGRLKQATCSVIVSQLLKKSEKDEIDEVFRNLDRTCDGYLDRDDLKKGYRVYFDLELTDADIDAVFQQVNVSGTGKIEYSEFAIAMMVQNDMIHNKLDAAFKFFDEEGKGYISTDDIQNKLCLVLNKHNPKLTKKILEQADQDGDGVITYDEFREMMLSTKITRQRRCSIIARTPRKPSMGLGVSMSSDESGQAPGEGQRRCSIARTPRKASLAFGICMSEESGSSLGSFGIAVRSINDGQMTTNNIRRGSKRASALMMENPLEELKEEESDNYDDISDDEIDYVSEDEEY